MWGYTHADPRRQSQAGPSTSPTSTYPPESYRRSPPRTPPGQGPHRKSLSRVEETVMEDQTQVQSPVARDYAQQGSSKGKERGIWKSPYEMSQTDTDEEYTYDQSRRRSSRKPSLGGVGISITTDGPTMIPPESIHDAYLSNYIEPIQTSTPGAAGPSGTNRPAVARSTSTPAPANGLLTSPISLKTSAAPIGGLGVRVGVDEPKKPQTRITTPITPTTAGAGQGKARGRPIFEIFNAEVSEGSDGMVRALKGHLEDVLKVQEEIGRMHLDLEGLGGTEERRGTAKSQSQSPKGNEGDEDSLKRREKGVDELMERLATLSNNLRTYHDLGTPTLSFSHSQPNTAVDHTSHPDSLPSGIGASTAPPPLNRLHSAHPDILTTSPDILSPSPPRADVPRSLPTRTPVAVHKGIDNLRRQEGLPSRRATVRLDPTTPTAQISEQIDHIGNGNASGQRQTSASSDLAPLHLSMDDYDIRSGNAGPSTGTGTGYGGGRTLQKKTSASFSDLAALQRDRDKEREREKAADSWMEYGVGPDDSDNGSRRNTSLRSSGVSRMAERMSQSQSRQGRTVDSPIEMVDRSRPW